MYEYKATVKRVIDGDSIVLDIDLGFNMVYTEQNVRLLGIDTPESRTRDLVEKQFGLLSKYFVEKFVAEANNDVIVRTYKDDAGKFGRILAEIINPITKEILNESLISKGYAVRYFGENKEKIESMHLINRKKLIDEGIINLSYEEAGIS